MKPHLPFSGQNFVFTQHLNYYPRCRNWRHTRVQTLLCYWFIDSMQRWFSSLHMVYRLIIRRRETVSHWCYKVPISRMGKLQKNSTEATPALSMANFVFKRENFDLCLASLPNTWIITQDGGIADTRELRSNIMLLLILCRGGSVVCYLQHVQLRKWLRQGLDTRY